MWTVIGWLLEWAVGKGADALVGSLSDSSSFASLAKELDREMAAWEKEVQKQHDDFRAAPLFERVDRSGDPAVHESIRYLWDEFRSGGVPSFDVWNAALLAAWRRVPQLVTVPQSFYILPIDEVAPLLDNLAVRLQQTCARNESFFRSSTDLFQRRAEDQLKIIRENLQQVRGLLGRDSRHEIAQALRQLRRVDQTLRRRERLAGSLRALIQRAEARCREVDRPLYTSDVLCEILRGHDGYALRCFEQLKQGLGQKVLRQLDEFNSTVGSEAPFLDLEWDERPDAASAAELATADESPRIQHKHLILAILHGSSATATSLRDRLGEERFARLIQEVQATPLVWVEHLATPNEGPFASRENPII